MMSSPAIPGTDDTVLLRSYQLILCLACSLDFPCTGRVFADQIPSKLSLGGQDFHICISSHYIPGINHSFIWQPLQFASFFDIILTRKYSVARKGTNVVSSVLSCSLHFALNFLHGPHCTNVEIISECSVKGSCRQVDKKYCWKSHHSAWASKTKGFLGNLKAADLTVQKKQVQHTPKIRKAAFPFQCNGSAIRQLQQCDDNKIL